MKKINEAYLILIVFLFTSNALAQGEDDRITVVGDSLVGKVVNGESIREVIGNVTLKQGDIVVTCEKAIQYLSRNEAELIGNVIVREDSLTIKTHQGFYYGNTKDTRSTTGIILDDKSIVLSADSGEYFFDEDRAFFQSNVKLVDSVSTLTADQLTYFKKEERVIATGNVSVLDETNLIKADSLDHYREDKTSYADGNVSVTNYENNTVIYGDHLEDFGKKKFSIVTQNPVLVQIDTTYSTKEDSLQNWRIDTLMIKSKIMEGYRDTTNLFIAIDSVKIIRGNFASVNNYTIYYRNDDKIVTKKTVDDGEFPILWYENSQLTGDSITISLEDNQIKMLEVNENAFMLSKHKQYEHRYDQMSSKDLVMYFNDNEISRAEFDGTIYTIYYLFEEQEPNGLSKSSAKAATLIFEENEVIEVRLYGSPTSEYYPEVKVQGLERTFTLPEFLYYENRPVKQNFLNLIEK